MRKAFGDQRACLRRGRRATDRPGSHLDLLVAFITVQIIAVTLIVHFHAAPYILR